MKMLQNIENMSIERLVQEQSLFDLGRIFISDLAEEALARAGDSIASFLQRHGTKDWGHENSQERERVLAWNERSLDYKQSVQSVYYLSDGTEIWITTDFFRNTQTTISLPYAIEMKDGRTMTTKSLTFTVGRKQ